MKVFISWSGSSSKKYAEALRNWLPAVLQFVKPYFTPSDIEKGTRWNTDIAKELESAEIGILCVTRDSLHSDWVLFEAGALSKSMDKTCVCPVLFGIQNTDLSGPLKQFQTTEFEKNDFKKLVSIINSKFGESKLSPKILDSVFDKWWPELESEISKTLIESTTNNEEKPVRSERDLLEEILELSRATMRSSRRTTSSVNLEAFQDFLKKFISLHDAEAFGDEDYQDTLDRLGSMKKVIEYISRRVRPRSSEFNELLNKFDELSFKRNGNEKSEDEDDILF